MTQMVNSEGPLKCKIALVGEAPGETEVRLGRPFVGASGNLLDMRLRGAGILRNKCFITNVVKVRPPKNNISVYLDLSKKVPIETDLYKEMLELLRVELTQCTANVIVAVGAVPLWALCGLKAITKRRGSIYPCKLVPGKKVIPIIHPAAALRQYIYNHYIAFDLGKVVKESEYPDIRIPKLNLIINPSHIDAMRYVDWLSVQSEFDWDIEVVNEEVSCVSMSPQDDMYEGICVSFDTWTVEQEADFWNEFGKLLENLDIRKCGQYQVFDSTFVFRKYGIRVTNIRDTMVAQAFVNTDFPKGLDFINSIYTPFPYYKDDLKKYIKMQVSKDVFWEYSAKDSISTNVAKRGLWEDLKALGNVEVAETQCRLIEPLIYMAEKGINTDHEGMKRESERVGIEIAGLQEQLNSVVGEYLNINSPKQLKEYFYIKKGIAPYKSRSGANRGAITVDKNALKRLSKRGFPEAKLILKMRALGKQKGTYLDVKVSQDGRIRCTFNPVGGDGRLSSSKNIFDEGSNLQNWPHPMLKFLLADKGYIIYNADLERADGVVVAHIAPEPRMIEYLESGVDLHAATAAGIFGIDIEDVTRDEGTCPICHDPDLCGHEGQRFWGKKAGHSFNYGLGYKQFAFLFEIDEVSSRNIRSGYLRTYPGLQTYWNWIQAELNRTRSLTDCWGWTRRFMDRWGQELFKQAYSYIPRSTVAGKINRDGILKIWDSSSLSKVEILNQVHDSAVFQIPISAGWDYHVRALREIKESLETPLRWKGNGFVISSGFSMGFNLATYDKEHNKIGQIDIKKFTNEELSRHYQTLLDGK